MVRARRCTPGHSADHHPAGDFQPAADHARRDPARFLLRSAAAGRDRVSARVARPNPGRQAASVASSARISLWAVLLAALGENVPNGIRTRAAAVKGRCPGPLDDGDAGWCGRPHNLAAKRGHEQAGSSKRVQAQGSGRASLRRLRKPPISATTLPGGVVMTRASAGGPTLLKESWPWSGLGGGRRGDGNDAGLVHQAALDQAAGHAFGLHTAFERSHH